MNQSDHFSPTPESSQRMAESILANAAREDMPVGSPLRASTIAEKFSVSRTPVSAALKYLSESGIVEYRRNKGFFLSLPARDAEMALRRRKSPDGDYLTFAREALAVGDGNTITLAQTVSAHGFSRTTAQQLLEQAASEGWLEKSAGHSWILRLGISTEADYARFYRFRETIEPAALREPGYDADDKELERLYAIQERLASGDLKTPSAVDLFEINRELHETMVQWSGNKFYADALRRSNDLRRVIEYTKVLKTERIDVFAKEHMAILRAVRKRDHARAANMVLKHLRGARRVKT